MTDETVAHPAQSRSSLGLWLCGLAAMLPPLRLLWILSHNGAYNPSNDDLAILQYLQTFMERGFSWKWLVSDSFVAGHSHFFPMLVQLASMKLTHWNLEWILYLGLGLALLKCLLLYELLAAELQSPWRVLLFPLISTLVFSATQLSSFDFEYVTISRGLSQLGFLLGLKGLLQFRRPRSGALLMLGGGLLAAFSSANGLNAWPVYFSLLFLPRRKPFPFLASWVLGAILVVALYLPHLHRDAAYMVRESRSASAWLQFYLSGLGWPFTNDFSWNQACAFGIAGILSFAALIYFFANQENRKAIAKVVPALSLVAFSLGNLLQISLVRANLAPWYASSFVFFWLGLAGLAFLVAEQASRLRLVAALSLAVMIGGLLWSNREWEDKVFYLKARTPFAESCLHRGLAENSDCVRAVFLWSNESSNAFRTFVAVLSQYHWSIFGPQQHWTMQGDAALGKIETTPPSGENAAVWVQKGDGAEGDPKGFRRLDLRIPDGVSAKWPLELPENLNQAVLDTAISASGSSGLAKATRLEISMELPDGRTRRIFRKTLQPKETASVAVDLSAYAGQAVKIAFAAEGARVTLRFPVLWLDLKDNP